MNTRKKGKIGEEIAVKYLLSKNYTILHRNFSVQTGEIDIVAEENKAIVFVEVKYRKNTLYGYPAEAVNFKKQSRILETAEYYIMYTGLEERDIRFDVIEILGRRINHIENAFCST